MSDLEQTRKKQEELGNHPRDTLMNIWDEDESYAISYHWFTGKAHKEWLEKTREKRLKVYDTVAEFHHKQTETIEPQANV